MSPADFTTQFLFLEALAERGHEKNCLANQNGPASVALCLVAIGLAIGLLYIL